MLQKIKHKEMILEMKQNKNELIIFFLFFV